jgi:hypothetical protein
MLFQCPHVGIMNYCVIELPTAENILVELVPMSRTVTTTSRDDDRQYDGVFSHVFLRPQSLRHCGSVL